MYVKSCAFVRGACAVRRFQRCVERAEVTVHLAVAVVEEVVGMVVLLVVSSDHHLLLLLLLLLRLLPLPRSSPPPRHPHDSCPSDGTFFAKMGLV